MTCREKLKIENPECVSDLFHGGCKGCPYDYGYLPDPEYCWYGRLKNYESDQCAKCWDREIPDLESRSSNG